MSKFVKQLEITELRRAFDGVDDLVIVNVIGLDAIQTTQLRAELRKKKIQLQVVKNSLAARVFEERGIVGLSPILSGSAAVAWGGEGIVELAKEITEWAKKLEKMTIKGGCIARQPLDTAGVDSVSKMPSRPELLARIAGLILSPGANLAAALLGPGGSLAGQIKEIAEKESSGAEAAPAA